MNEDKDKAIQEIMEGTEREQGRMEVARAYREGDRQEIVNKYEQYRLGTETNFSLFNFILYCHDLTHYEDDMDLLKQFYSRMYPSLVNFQRSNEVLRDILIQNMDKLNSAHRKLLEKELEKPSPFQMAETALKEAAAKAKARANLGIEIYNPKILLK
jgi:hypothetical protein